MRQVQSADQTDALERTTGSSRTANEGLHNHSRMALPGANDFQDLACSPLLCLTESVPRDKSYSKPARGSTSMLIHLQDGPS